MNLQGSWLSLHLCYSGIAVRPGINCNWEDILDFIKLSNYFCYRKDLGRKIGLHVGNLLFFTLLQFPFSHFRQAAKCNFTQADYGDRSFCKTCALPPGQKAWAVQELRCSTNAVNKVQIHRKFLLLKML